MFWGIIDSIGKKINTIEANSAPEQLFPTLFRISSFCVQQNKDIQTGLELFNKVCAH